MRCKKSGKAIYLKGVAISIAKKRNIAKGENGHAYLCPHCDGWHVTKQPKKWPLDKPKKTVIFN